jgi:hypothetical protein
MIARARPDEGGGWGFWLEALAVEPRDDPAWEAAPAALVRQFWAEAGHYASRVWKRHRAQGMNRDGEPMDAISLLTAQARQDDVNSVTGRAPYSPMGRASAGWAPLQATGGQSRLQTLLRWKAVEGQGVWFYWNYDRHTRHYWGEILARHARGFRQFFRYPRTGWGRVPGRDVFGFSEAELELVRVWMASWWGARRGLVAGAPGAGTPAAAGRTRGILQRVRAAKPPGPGRVVRVERTPRVLTMGPTLRLGPEGRLPAARPVPVKPPPLRARELVDYSRKPLPPPGRPAPPRIRIRHAGPVDREFEVEALRAIGRLPSPILQLLAKSRRAVTLAERMADVLTPEELLERPRNHPPGTTWENVAAMRHDQFGPIVCRTYVDPSSGHLEAYPHVQWAVLHEVSHEVDLSLKGLSATAEWLRAHSADAATLAGRADLGYYLERDGGAEETFASLLPQLLGVRGDQPDMLAAFPRCVRLLRRRLGLRERT